MKRFLTVFAITVSFLLSSCMKDEPLNSECDIVQAYVTLANPSSVFYNLTDTLLNVPSDANDITFKIIEGSDLTSLAPVFKITDGATIEPASGSVHDFSDGKAVVYKVTSQDGHWQRTYNVRFKATTFISEFCFENYKLVDGANGGQYYAWSDFNQDGSEASNWATGNAGFNLSMGSAKPEAYPTSVLSEGYKGAGVKLVTRNTGMLGALAGMRLAAGNLFLGYFNVSIALLDAMQATEFGVPFDRRPLRLTGYYKYKPGDKFQDKQGKLVEGKIDTGDIYAVLYNNHDAQGNSIRLHGNDVKTHSNIVAIAEVNDMKVSDEWTYFDVDFLYKGEIDESLLSNHGYNIALVCTSSIEGASFCGAIGSTLLVDELKIICE